jgi:hypothetical protein
MREIYRCAAATVNERLSILSTWRKAATVGESGVAVSKPHRKSSLEGQPCIGAMGAVP